MMLSVTIRTNISGMKSEYTATVDDLFGEATDGDLAADVAGKLLVELGAAAQHDRATSYARMLHALRKELESTN